MVSKQELIARIQEFFRISRQEINGLIAATIITALVFSFRDWGEDSFDFLLGLSNFLAVWVLVVVTFIFRISCQKIYGLSQGLKAEFKVWWSGLLIALVLAFLSAGLTGGKFVLPLILAGTMVSSFMVKQRLGEFRYGFSYYQGAVLSLWGVIGNLILALLFSISDYFLPGNYFIEKGILLNLIMAFCSLLPLPQLDGLIMYFGSRTLYFTSIAIASVTSILLLSKTKIGLIITLIAGAVAGIFYILISSEK